MPENLKTFETERLILRPTNPEDAAFLFELINSPKWIQFIGDRNVHSIEEAKEYIKLKIQPQQERLGFSNYTVIRKIDHVKMGTCGLYDREGLEGIDIGFAFLTQYEKNGYAFEAAKKIKTVGLEVFGLKQICAITTKDNFSSQKLLEKLGLKFKTMVSIPNDETELMKYELFDTSDHKI